MNHTPERSGVLEEARVFAVLGCGAVCAKITRGKARAAAPKIEMMD